MEYLKRDTLASAPAPEPTAFTMQSIRELLTETGDEGLLDAAPKSAPAAPPVAAAPAPAPVEQPRVQSPPSAESFGTLPKVQPRPVAPAPAPVAAQNVTPIRPTTAKRPAKQGLGQRLSERLFGRA